MNRTAIVAAAAWLAASIPALTPAASRAQADEPNLDALFAEAMSVIDWRFEESWAFTKTSLEDGILRIARFDPRRPGPERWTLLSIDGEQPEADEIAAFRRDKGSETGLADAATDVDGMVRPGTLRLIGQTADRWILGFVPDEDNEDLAGNIEGRAVIAKDGPWLESIEFRNTAVVSAGLGTRIQDFLTRYRFAPAVDGGPIVLHATEERVKGQALLFIDFDEVEVNRYSDFEFLGTRDLP